MEEIMDAKKYAAKCAISAGEALMQCPAKSSMKCYSYKLLVGTAIKAEAPFLCANCIRKKWDSEAELVDLRFRLIELIGWQYSHENCKIYRAKDNDIWRERVTLAAEYQRRAIGVFKCNDKKKLKDEISDLRKALHDRCKQLGEGNVNAN